METVWTPLDLQKKKCTIYGPFAECAALTKAWLCYIYYIVYDGDGMDPSWSPKEKVYYFWTICRMCGPNHGLVVLLVRIKTDIGIPPLPPYRFLHPNEHILFKKGFTRSELEFREKHIHYEWWMEEKIIIYYWKGQIIQGCTSVLSEEFDKYRQIG